MLQQLKSIPLVRKMGRWWVKTFLEGTVTPIYQGHAQGMLWKRCNRYINGFWVGDFEPEFQAAVASILKPGMTFYDVGANAGFYSLVAWKQIGGTGKCVSIDPDPQNCRHMQELKRINHLDNWHIIETAVSDKIGTVTFQTRNQGDPGGHLTSLEKFTGDNPTGLQNREVSTTTLDALVKEYGKPDVMKIDIEGAEWEAFRAGAEQLLTQSRPVLLMELHGNERANRLKVVFEKHHYQLMTLTGEPALFAKNDIFHVVARPQ